MDKTIDNFCWLAGQWEGIHGSGIYHEEWKPGTENDLTGRAYFVNKGELKNEEKLRIHSDGKDLFYTAIVNHNPGPVSFKLTESDDEHFVFENPGHDFPKKITYIKKSGNELRAIIEAGESKVEFNLRRAQ